MSEPRADDAISTRLARGHAVTTAAFTWLLAMTILPIAIWHRMLGDIFGAFHWSLGYVLSDLSPWLLLLAGIGFMLPVAISAGRSPESRLYPRARRAYAAWGTVVYLLGLVLAVELAEVWRYAH
jgi:hypothetical protein